MTDPKPQLSREEFDRLIARAMELDQQERVDLEQARTIAEELGVSREAWDAALREHGAEERRIVVARTSDPLPRWCMTRVAAAGLLTGGISGLLAGRLGDVAILLGTGAIVAGVGLVLDGRRRRTWRATQAVLASWWLAVFVGIMMGLGEIHPDTIAFVAVAWLGCFMLSAVVFRRAERLREAVAKR